LGSWTPGVIHGGGHIRGGDALPSYKHFSISEQFFEKFEK